MSAPTMRELCAKATPGPWKHAGGAITDAKDEPVGNTRGRGRSIEEMHYTGKYIARLSPEVVMEVVAALESADIRLVNLLCDYTGPCPALNKIRRTLSLLNGEDKP